MFKLFISEMSFHYCLSLIFSFQDSFADALTSWFRASLLDPAWPAPRTSAMRCLSALRQINSEISSSSQSKLTRKRIHGLVGSLAPCLSGTGLAKLLGPYSPDSTKTKDMPKLDLQLFEDLKVRFIFDLSSSISMCFI